MRFGNGCAASDQDDGPRHGRARSLRSPPGRLVLPDGAAASLRLCPHRPRLPRGLLRGLLSPHVAPRGPGVARSSRRRRRARSPRHARPLIPALVVFLYLAIVVYIGVFAFRRSTGAKAAEDYFLAGRALGPFVFLMSLFGTNMTAFAI